MRILRKHWLLILLIVIGLLWWPISDFFAPAVQKLPYDHQPIRNVDYWSLVAYPQASWILLFGFIAVIVVAFFRALRISNVATRVLVMISVFLLCGIINCASASSYFHEGWAFSHIMTTEYHGKVYQLAQGTYDVPFDIALFLDYVFECDSAGEVCSELSKSYSGDIKIDHLIVSDDKLILVRGSEHIQILPAVN